VGFFKKLASFFSGGAGSGASTGDDGRTHWVYVRCNVCGEPIAIRVDLHNDLSPEWNDSSASGNDQPDYYSVHKTVIGRERCYKPIEVELVFSRSRQVESERAVGGTLLTADEYEKAKAEWEAKKSGRSSDSEHS
jgi:hypothetical protein